MDIGTMALVAVVIILFEFSLHTRNKIKKASQEKFEEWKKSYLIQKESKATEETGEATQPTSPES